MSVKEYNIKKFVMNEYILLEQYRINYKTEPYDKILQTTTPI
jgi:hypothetical protein